MRKRLTHIYLDDLVREVAKRKARATKRSLSGLISDLVERGVAEDLAELNREIDKAGAGNG